MRSAVATIILGAAIAALAAASLGGCAAESKPTTAMTLDPSGLMEESARALEAALALDHSWVTPLGDEREAELAAELYARAKIIAARELLRAGSRKAADFLAEFLAQDIVCLQSKACRQRAALEELRGYSGRMAQRTIMRILARVDRPYGEYADAAEALWASDPERAERESLNAVRDGNPGLARGLIEGGNAAAPDRLAPFLRRLLAGDDERFRLLAAVKLAARGDAAGVPALQEVFRRAPTAYLDEADDAASAAKALGQVFAAGGRTALLNIIAGGEAPAEQRARFQRLAALEFCRRAAKEDVAALYALANFTPHRRAAVEALAGLDFSMARPLLERVIENEAEDAALRTRAAWWLARNGDQQALAFVVNALENNPQPEPAAWLLELGNDDGAAEFRALLKRAFGAERPPEKPAEGNEEKGGGAAGALAQLAPILVKSVEIAPPDKLIAAWRDILATPSPEMHAAFWRRLGEYEGPFAAAAEIFRAAMSKDKGLAEPALTACLSRTAPADPAELKDAALLLRSLIAREDSRWALSAAEVACQRDLLDKDMRDAIRKACFDQALRGESLRALVLLTRVAQREDLAYCLWLTRRIPEPIATPHDRAEQELTPAFAALVIRQVVRDQEGATNVKVKRGLNYWIFGWFLGWTSGE